MAEIVESQPEPAKNRTSCDLCKRMKIKCEKHGARCNHCISRDAECVVTIVPRKKRQKKTDYLATLEDRLMKMEAVITAASSTSAPASTSNSQTPEPIDDYDKEQAALTDKLSTLYIGPTGKAKYLGSSSGFWLVSPQGLEWITKKTGSTKLFDMIVNLAKSHSSESELSDPMLFAPMPHDEREPLPSPELKRSYIDAFFRSMNTTFPVFDEEFFKKDLARNPDPTPDGDSSWYAALNMVIALGSLFSSTIEAHWGHKNGEGQVPNASELHCWKYFRNASSLYIDLSFKEPSLLSVQAMVLMALMIQATNDPHPSWMCTATAARLAHSVGLHRKMAYSGLTEAEMEQRSNVFWTLYSLEQGQSLRSGRPSTIQDNDIGIDMPKALVYEGKPGGKDMQGTFHKNVELARISCRVYHALYTAKSQTQSRLERLKLVGQFDKELEQWRDSVQTEQRPGEPILVPQEMLVPVIMTHFHYYFTLTTIHRVSVYHGYWTNEQIQADPQWAHDAQINPRVFASGVLCVSAARNTMRLFMHHSTQIRPTSIDTNLLRMADYFPISSLFTLFANCLQHPNDENAPVDVELMISVMSILRSSMTYQAQKIREVVPVFDEIVNTARLFVDRAQAQDRHKRGHSKAQAKNNDQYSLGASPQKRSSSGSIYTPEDSASSISPDEFSVPTPRQPASSQQQPHFSHSLASNQAQFIPPPSNPSFSNPSNSSQNLQYDPLTFSSVPVPTGDTTSPDTSGWWPPTLRSNDNANINEASNAFPGFGSPSGDMGYVPFNFDANLNPSVDDPNFLNTWDPNVFLPLSTNFQWDLADLWTEKRGV